MPPVIPAALAIISFCPPTGVVPTTQPGQNILRCFFPKTNDGGGNGEAVESHTLTATAGITVTNYPNPVRSGSDLNLRFDLTAPATATIVVSDIAGREIYRAE